MQHATLSMVWSKIVTERSFCLLSGQLKSGHQSDPTRKRKRKRIQDVLHRKKTAWLMVMTWNPIRPTGELEPTQPIRLAPPAQRQPDSVRVRVGSVNLEIDRESYRPTDPDRSRPFCSRDPAIEAKPPSPALLSAPAKSIFRLRPSSSPCSALLPPNPICRDTAAAAG